MMWIRILASVLFLTILSSGCSKQYTVSDPLTEYPSPIIIPYGTAEVGVQCIDRKTLQAITAEVSVGIWRSYTRPGYQSMFYLSSGTYQIVAIALAYDNTYFTMDLYPGKLSITIPMDKRTFKAESVSTL